MNWKCVWCISRTIYGTESAENRLRHTIAMDQAWLDQYCQLKGGQTRE